VRTGTEVPPAPSFGSMGVTPPPAFGPAFGGDDDAPPTINGGGMRDPDPRAISGRRRAPLAPPSPPRRRRAIRQPADLRTVDAGLRLAAQSCRRIGGADAVRGQGGRG
jgi:hypothetical protein